MPYYLGERRISGLGIDQSTYTVNETIYSTPLELRINVPSGQAGEAYMVGTGDQLTVYIWDTVNLRWSESSLYVPVSDVGLIAARGYKALLRVVDAEENNTKLQYCYEDDVTATWTDLITFNEGTRNTNEAQRVSTEAARRSAEITRASAESIRQSNESNRAVAETGRVTVEGNRVTAETGRSASEASRISAESGRQTNESTRNSTEAARVSAESTRATNELQRISAEASRVIAETGRNTTEGLRVTAETGRVNAELSRVAYNNQYRVLEPFNLAKSNGYKQYNKVIYNGSTYEAISDVPMGIDPTNATYWIMIASKATLAQDDMDLLVTQLAESEEMQEAFISSARLGQPNGSASLDSLGKVPSGQLPSYVDDVIEGYFKTADNLFYTTSGYTVPITGESGKIYVDIGGTNKTYRYSGSIFVEISQGVVLGTTSATAYRGDYGNTAYVHSQSAHAPVGAEANVITSIKLNGATLSITDKTVDIVSNAMTFSNITATADGWNTGTKKQTITVSGMTSTANANLYVLTAAGRTMFSTCGVVVDSQTTNSITLSYSSSSAPSSDVACQIALVN